MKKTAVKPSFFTLAFILSNGDIMDKVDIDIEYGTEDIYDILKTILELMEV